MGAHIETTDVKTWAAAYDGPPFHALLCDPPYHLTPGGGAARGFMGKSWDGGDLAFRPDTWAVLAGRLHPGAFGCAFASSRGWHRMAVAIEDAGLIMHSTIFMLGWANGNGMTKGTRIRQDGQDAAAFVGYRYGQQTLRPALEPIILFQKPYEGRATDCITTTGAGALNIDGTRALAPSDDDAVGRWPANIVLTHSPDCAPGRCADDCPIQKLDAQSGRLSSGKGTASRSAASSTVGYRPHVYGAESRVAGTTSTLYGDSGGASRFYFNADYLLERLADELPVFYTGKASRWEKEAGLERMTWTVVGDGRKKPIDNAFQRGKTKRRNTHPTIKPLALTHWLATLLLPPDGYAPRRLLVPFSGSGSEMIGARLAGWEDVWGIEQSAEYAAIARQRLDFWQRFAGGDFETAYKAAKRATAKQKRTEQRRSEITQSAQLPLFEGEVAR